MGRGRRHRRRAASPPRSDSPLRLPVPQLPATAAAHRHHRWPPPPFCTGISSPASLYWMAGSSSSRSSSGGGCVLQLFPGFYGWVVATVLVASQMIGHIGSVHLISLSIGRIYADFETEFGVPTDKSAAMWMVGCLLAAVCASSYGRAIDVWGGRVCVPAALALMAAGNFVMTCTTSRATTALFGVSVFMQRSAAMGMLNPYTNTILSHWFSRRRGLAISVVEVASMFITTFVVAQLWQHGRKYPLCPQLHHMLHARSSPLSNHARALCQWTRLAGVPRTASALYSPSAWLYPPHSSFGRRQNLSA